MEVYQSNYRVYLLTLRTSFSPLIDRYTTEFSFGLRASGLLDATVCRGFIIVHLWGLIAELKIARWNGKVDLPCLCVYLKDIIASFTYFENKSIVSIELVSGFGLQSLWVFINLPNPLSVNVEDKWKVYQERVVHMGLKSVPMGQNIATTKKLARSRKVQHIGQV